MVSELGTRTYFGGWLNNSAMWASLLEESLLSNDRQCGGPVL